MRAMRRIGVGLLFVSLVFLGRSRSHGQASPVPYANFLGFSFRNIAPAFSYSGSYTVIRQIDFKNFKIHYFDKDVQLTNGSFKHRETMGKTVLGVEELVLENVHYLTPAGSAPEFAVCC